MKKRLASYMGIFVILSSFLVTPITVLAETLQSSEQNQPTESVKPIESTDNTEKNTNSQSQISSEKLTSSTKDEKPSILKTTETDQKQASEATQSSEQQSRAPTIVKREVQENSKRLKNVITNIGLWDVNNGEYVKQIDGVYQMIKNVPYRYETNFDLSAYDGNLNDGDYFTFTIPEPVTVTDTNFELKDEKTDVMVGDVTVTSNGEGKGATVKITLKNLAEYLAKTGGTQVQGVKGTFYTEFTVKETTEEKTITYNPEETSKEITHKIFVKDKDDSDYSEIIKKENFAKINGVIKAGDWASELLGKSGKYYHPFTVRINARQATYNTISIHDFISKNHAPTQFIPETFKIQWGYYNSKFTFVTDGELVAGTDYSLTWNSSYTDLIATINNASTRIAGNGKPAAYRMLYSTTAPANGTKIANYVEMAADGQELTNTTEVTTKRIIVERESKVTTGGIIQLETGYRITIYKQDSETGNLINGAEFEITSPSGDKEVIKIEKGGVAQSKVYSAEEVSKGKFTIVETKAPIGYILDNTPMEVNVGEEGIVRTINNTKEKIAIPITKTWNDSNNQDGKRPTSIIVNLLADGKKVASKELTEAEGWQYTFENLPKYENGQEIVYTVTEDQVPEYNTEIKGYDITNSYTPGKTSISVTKAWNDNNNQDGLRPNSVQAQLYANGKAEGSPVELNEGNQWSHTWNDLPEKANGQAIVYTVKEVTQVPGYTSVVDDSNLGNVRITNTHTPVVKSDKGNSSTPKKITLNKKYFPQTGEQQSKILIILGIVILIGIVFVIFYKRKMVTKK